MNRVKSFFLGLVGSPDRGSSNDDDVDDAAPTPSSAADASDVGSGTFPPSSSSSSSSPLPRTKATIAARRSAQQQRAKGVLSSIGGVVGGGVGFAIGGPGGIRYGSQIGRSVVGLGAAELEDDGDGGGDEMLARLRGEAAEVVL